MRKLFAVILVFAMLFGLGAPAMAEETPKSEDIVILYTNDVHSYIDGALSYDVIAAVKADLETQYEYVLLVDAGDHIQGAAYGSMDKGETVIKLMNAAGYDAATLGNHEFDYGMSGCMSVIEWADFPYLSCNFYHESNGVRGENVLDSYRIFDCGANKVAFVGITTPETISKSTPLYVQDENGNYIYYGISGTENAGDMYADVQKAIDEAKANGADHVIALGHLGIDISSGLWTSEETIAAVSGLDAFIDGHSHSAVKGKPVSDKNGEEVLLTQTGQYFDRMGIMIIDSETGDVAADFIQYQQTAEGKGTMVSDLYDGAEFIADAEVKALKDDWLKKIDESLGQIIGFAEVTLDNYDAEGKRLVRLQETNSSDFCTDALYYLFDNMGMDVDIALINGGCVRNTAVTGDLTYLTCKNINPFGNVACLQTVTGQQILDALEWGSREVGTGAEAGGFLHASGLTYKLDASIPSTAQGDGNDVWTGPPTGEYRVYDVKVYNKDTDSWDKLDLNAKYNLAGHNYVLRDLGGGLAMFEGAVNILDYVMEDHMVLANYIQGFENGVVGAVNSPLLEKYPNFMLDYSDVNGSGRIVITDGKNDGKAFIDIDADAWYTEAVDYVTEKGLMNGVGGGRFDPNGEASRAMIVTVLWRLEGEPVCGQGKSGTFADVPEYTWYTEAVEWAASKGIVNGYGVNFGPEDSISREQLAAMLYRYEQYRGGGFKGLWMFLLDYADRAEISQWAYEALCWMTVNNVMQGRGEGILDPLGGATRGEAARMLTNYLEKQY